MVNTGRKKVERSRRSVYIAYTGGTIGMRRGERGYQPAPGYLAERMRQSQLLNDPDMPRYEIHEYEPLLDSSNMTPARWSRIGQDLYDHYDEYDGFIVLHGTDTMAYSAAALSFLFENLGKPIIFTGSQVPLAELRTDARENLVTSLLLAAGLGPPEVCLFVGNRLLRGNRATKVSAERFRAFASPNYPPLGDAGVHLRIYRERALQPPEGPPSFHPAGNAQVADVRLFPGITAETLRRFLGPPLEGAILHTFGSGNAPDDPDLLAALAEASERGVVIVNCTQCLQGTVDMESYATGNSLREAGVISGYDMTPEAALPKLYYLLSRGLPNGEVKRLMQTDLRGELTPPEKRRTHAAWSSARLMEGFEPPDPT
jgi:L-asparaginase